MEFFLRKPEITNLTQPVRKNYWLACNFSGPYFMNGKTQKYLLLLKKRQREGYYIESLLPKQRNQTVVG